MKVSAMNSSKKRRRVSQSVSLDSSAKSATSHTKDKHEVFTDYARSRGVFIGPARPAVLPGRGTGLVTTAPIKKDECILFVPEKAMFKPSAAALKKLGVEKTTSPQAQLALSLTVALTTEDSPLRPWEHTWPTLETFRESMPYFWDEDLHKLLPPSIIPPLERVQVDFRKDTDHEVVSRWLAQDSTRDTSWTYYWFVVNSRCFHFKPPGSKPGFLVLCPFIDYLNHGSSGSGCIVKQSPKGYEVTADRDYECGEELLATYGAHSNEKLLVHYGFVLPHEVNPSVDDDIRLDHIILPQLKPETREQLQDVGYLGGYALIPATNEICFKTQVAVRAALLTATEWEYFMTNGDDLSDDQSAKVKEWLRPVMEEYHSTAVQMLQKATAYTGENPVGQTLLKARWTQIRDSLEIFLQDHGSEK